jgi:hypothetical protein
LLHPILTNASIAGDRSRTNVLETGNDDGIWLVFNAAIAHESLLKTLKMFDLMRKINEFIATIAKVDYLGPLEVLNVSRVYNNTSFS